MNALINRRSIIVMCSDKGERERENGEGGRRREKVGVGERSGE